MPLFLLFPLLPDDIKFIPAMPNSKLVAEFGFESTALSLCRFIVSLFIAMRRCIANVVGVSLITKRKQITCGVSKCNEVVNQTRDYREKKGEK